jgi:hypothetical protein
MMMKMMFGLDFTDDLQIPWGGADAYNKNLTVQMGRCPVRSVAPQALEILKKNQHKLGYVDSPFTLERMVC